MRSTSIPQNELEVLLTQYFVIIIMITKYEVGMIENSEIAELCKIYQEIDDPGKKKIIETAAQLLVAQKAVASDDGEQLTVNIVGNKRDELVKKAP